MESEKAPFFWKLLCQEVSTYFEKLLFLKTILSRSVFLLWTVENPIFLKITLSRSVFLCSWILWQWSLFWNTRGGWNKPFGLSILSLEVSPNVCLKRTNIDKSKVSNLRISLPSVHLWLPTSLYLFALKFLKSCNNFVHPAQFFGAIKLYVPDDSAGSELSKYSWSNKSEFCTVVFFPFYLGFYQNWSRIKLQVLQESSGVGWMIAARCRAARCNCFTL